MFFGVRVLSAVCWLVWFYVRWVWVGWVVVFFRLILCGAACLSFVLWDKGYGVCWLDVLGLAVCFGFLIFF